MADDIVDLLMPQNMPVCRVTRFAQGARPSADIVDGRVTSASWRSGHY